MEVVSAAPTIDPRNRDGRDQMVCRDRQVLGFPVAALWGQRGPRPLNYIGLSRARRRDSTG